MKFMMVPAYENWRKLNFSSSSICPLPSCAGLVGILGHLTKLVKFGICEIGERKVRGGFC